MAIQKYNDIEFKFIATEETPKSRLALGYYDMNKEYDFVVCTFESDENLNKAYKICEEADVVIIGSAPNKFVKQRIKKQKLTFYCAERIFKEKMKFYEWPFRCLKYLFKYTRHKNVYLLCASAYSAKDYAVNGAFINKTYKWGYFPEVKKYDNIEKLIEQKKKNSILWAGRLIDWKHPEKCIEAAKYLRDKGYDFTLNIIGTGDMQNQLEEMIVSENLQGYVSVLGSMSPDKVREYMENSQIYLFTSDRNEGWGAVLNEAMNSGCAVVTGHAIGSTAFLVKDGENGFVYKSGDAESLYQKTLSLINDVELRKKMGQKAYETMVGQWSAENAAERFLALSKEILNGTHKPRLFSEGPCSKAELLKDNWYKG